MNTSWLKIAGLVIVIAVAVVLIRVFLPSEKSEPAAQPQAKDKTFYDMVERDKEKFLAEPEPAEETTAQQKQTPVKQAPTEPTKLYFKPLSEIEEIEAERLLNVAVPGRSIGRLPMASGAGFRLMVDNCRQIIRKWPDSWYAYKAKQMLIDMPAQYRERYKITKEELDISKFTRQRPGTEPFEVTIKEETP